MPDDLVQLLIDRRQFHAKELERIDKHLLLEGVDPGSLNGPGEGRVQSLATSRTDAATESEDPIAYAEEVRAFIASLNEGDSFRFPDLLAFVEKRNPGAEINDNSLRGAFGRLTKSQDVELTKKGAGRMPATYRKPLTKEEPDSVLSAFQV